MLVLTRAGYAKPATSLNFKTGTWRVQKPVHHHHAAPCHSVCPAGEDAQAYIAHVQAGHLQLQSVTRNYRASLSPSLRICV